MNRLKWLLSSLFGLVFIFALGCGQAPPSFEEIENQINNPTAPVNSQTTSKAYTGYQTGRSSSQAPGVSSFGKVKTKFLKTGGGAVPFYEYLRRAGIPSGVLAKIAPYLPLDNKYRMVRKNQLYEITPSAQFKVQSIVPEFGDAAIGQGNRCVKVHVSTDMGLSSGSGTFEVDLACAGIGSGRVIIEVYGRSEGGQVDFMTQITFAQACDKEGNCVDGIIKIKASASGLKGTNTTRCMGGAAGTRCIDPPTSDNVRATLIFAMFLKVWNKNTGESAEVKAGFKVYADSGNQTAKVEALVWVKDEEGQEGTLTLILSADGKNKTAKFKVKGSNGMFECAVSEGKGECHGIDNNGEKFQWSVDAN